MHKIAAYIKSNVVFLVSLGIIGVLMALGLIFSANLNDVSASISNWVSDWFGWLYVLFVFFLICFFVWISFSKYGKVKLGSDDSKPEYSNFSWYSMLFCGGTGIGLVFWSIAEPLSHYAEPPKTIEAGTQAAADFSIRTVFLHWGVTQWVCFAIVGLCLAYFQFRKGKNGLISSLLSPLLGDRLCNGVVGKIIDVFAVVVSFAGVATSLGLGVSQISGGMNYLTGMPNNKWVWLGIILVITAIFIASSVSGLKKGIKFLSNLNTIIAFTLLILAFAVGPKIPILNTMVNGLGQHLEHFFGDVLSISANGDPWYANWRIFYYAWFIAWTPFVGMFFARISKGRTIREFVFGVVVIPTLFSIVWLSVFGGIALQTTLGWSLDSIRQLVASPETAVFIVFKELPIGQFLSVLVIVLLAIFFITSADSATYSLSLMSTCGDDKPPVYKKVIWGIAEAMFAWILLSAGSLKPLQTISIAASLPFLFVMILMIPALLKELFHEDVPWNKNLIGTVAISGEKSGDDEKNFVSEKPMPKDGDTESTISN